MPLYLGHRKENAGVGLTAYSTQPLPERPAQGKEVHPVTCHACQQAIDVTIMDEQLRFGRRALKIILGTLVGLIAVTMAIQTANTPSDPVTFEQPGYVVWAVWGWVGVIILCLCAIAFGVRDPGAYLRIPGKGVFGRFAVGHRVINP